MTNKENKVLNMIDLKELAKCAKNLNILFVEDHHELRENTADILSSFFKNVVTAEDGQKALDIYLEYSSDNAGYFDIILSDIQMPLLDGVELTKKVYEINSKQIVIILSAYDESKYLLPLVNLGIEHFIKKPIDYQELLSVLLNASKKITQPSSKSPDTNLLNIQIDKDFTFNKEESSLFHKNSNVYLTKYEIIFLQLLTTSVGKIYSNEDIVENYNSQNESIDPQNIRKLVSKLRKKLPESTLESIYGIGYKITPYFDN